VGIFDRLVPITTAQFGVVNGYVGTSAIAGVAVRATSYIAQASAVQRSINSTSANDTSAGTGARTVRVFFFDGSVNGPNTEDVTLNGTTAVNMVATNVQYIEKIQVLTVGSVGSNVGTIQLWTTTVGGGSVFASIAASDNQTFWAQHYVGAGRTCYLVGFRASSTIASGGATLQSTGDPGNSALAFSNITGTLRHENVIELIDWDPWLMISGPNMVIVNERPDNAIVQTAYASFDYVEF